MSPPLAEPGAETPADDLLSTNGQTMHIGIVGLGPWGLCALARIFSRAKLQVGRPLQVHIVEPALPGVGIYDTTLPDYLVMNNACGDIRFPTPSDLAGGGENDLGLFDWAVGRGYRWVGRRCGADASGEALKPDDFLPRRIMGEYLHWCYQKIMRARPGCVEVEHYATNVIDIVPSDDGREDLRLADGRRFTVDHAILTFGNVENKRSGAVGNNSTVNFTAPYPTASHPASVTPDARVAVCGMGLVATDVVMSLTEGLGGVFEEDGDHSVYHRSGREPAIYMFSRSGLPFRAKDIHPSQVTDRSAAFVFKTGVVRDLLSRGPASIDFADDVLPLLLREMSARYYIQAAFETVGASEARRCADQLRGELSLSDFDASIERLGQIFGAFDPSALFYGEGGGWTSAGEFERQVYDAILGAIWPSPRSGPIAAACETFRVLRDSLRMVVEHQRLTLASHLEFHGRLAGNINRLVSGPPAWRLRQLLALIDAGVLRVPFGPAPDIRAPAHDGGPYLIVSTWLNEPCEREVDLLVRGHLEAPRLESTASPLMSALHRRGRLVPLRYDDIQVGSVEINPDGNPIALDGCGQRRLWFFGAATEGALFSTHYIPSPHRGARAYNDIDRCIAKIFECPVQSEAPILRSRTVQSNVRRVVEPSSDARDSDSDFAGACERQ